MRPMKLTLAFCAIAILACTGSESVDTAPIDTGSEGGGDEVPDWEQTSSCEDYLDCLEAVAPAEAEEAEEAYGNDGSCWGDDDDVAQACDQACEDLLAGLLDDNPEEPACGGTGGDTGTDTGKDTGSDTGTDTGGDTGSSNACPLDTGTWTVEHEWTNAECGLGSTGPSEIEVACDRGDMTLSIFVIESPPLELSCWTDGPEFECEGVEASFGATMTYIGTANGSGTSASGTVELNVPSFCASNGIFSATL